MYRLLTFAAVLLFAQNASALRCAQPDPSWWPSSSTVPSQPLVVLGQERLTTAWFQGPDRVDATIETVGDYQFIRPKTPLTVGATYTLQGSNKQRFAKGPWRRLDGKQVPLKWTIGAQSAAPTWVGGPTAGSGSAHQDRWGTVSQQTLNLDWTGPTSAIAEIRLTRGTTVQRHLLPIAQGKPLTFGDSLCFRRFRLDGDGEWTATITLIGSSGQRSTAKSVSFPSPVAKPR